jgi:tight adherence protein B
MLIFVLFVFVALTLFGYAASRYAVERQEAKESLDRRLSSMTGMATTTVASSVIKDRRLSGIAALNSLLARVSLVGPLVRMIRQAGLKRRAGEVILYIPLLACTAFLVVMLLGLPKMFGLLAGIVAGSIPLFVISRMRARRLALFSEQLPDALDLIRAALQAGHGFVSALQVVAQEFPDPISWEFSEVAEEIRLGLPMRDALYHLMDRVDDPNLPILVVGVLITQEVGGNLAEVLNNTTYTIRERFKLMREIRVMTAQGRLSGMVLTALPFIVGAALFFWNPIYFMPMIERPAGIHMLAYALCSLLVGHLAMRRIVQIRV